MSEIIKWKVPEGYRLNTGLSHEREIILEKIENEVPEDKKVTSWDELCRKLKGKDSYYFDDVTIEKEIFGTVPAVCEFADEEDTEAFAALSKLLKLRKDWVGDWKPDWTSQDGT